MDFIVYGHSGEPLIVFPAQDGHPQDYENFGKNEIDDREKALLKFLNMRWKVGINFLEKYPHPGGDEYEFEDENIDNVEEIIDFE